MRALIFLILIIPVLIACGQPIQAVRTEYVKPNKIVSQGHNLSGPTCTCENLLTCAQANNWAIEDYNAALSECGA
jgi:hypothetical protein